MTKEDLKAMAEFTVACVKPQRQHYAVEVAKDYLRLLAQEEARGEGWQSMATAPKDRRWLLGWEADLGYFIWRDGPGLINGEDPEPTHWMPLPAAPTAPDQEG